jgi:phosphotriesterase-related protein
MLARPAAGPDAIRAGSHSAGVICALAWVLLVGTPGHVQAAGGVDPTPPGATGRIMTVLGPIEPGELGTTLTHEHIFIDFTLPLDQPARWKMANRRFPRTAEDFGIWNMPVTDPAHRAFLIRNAWENRDMLLLQDVETSVAEVLQFKAAGGDAIVDVTSIGIGRDPRKLLEVARRSGLHIVMGAGWYRPAWHPEGHEARSVESLTEEIVRDLTVGVGDTGIRAGIIGEVSAMNVVTEPEDSVEARGIRAAARASRMTGAAITLHQWYRDGTNLQRTLDLIEREGGDLSRVIVGHMDGVTSQDLGTLRKLLDRGVTLEFDLLGTPFRLNIPVMAERPMVDAVVALIREGYGERLLLSHDVCTKFQQARYGGNGFTYVAIEVVPYLRQHGITDEQVRRLLVDNPRRLLTLAPARPSPSAARAGD